jgi:hypothetical protein
MAYFLFQNIENLTGTFFKCVETQSELNNLNIIQSQFKIIEDTKQKFDDVILGNIKPISFTGNSINYENTNIVFDSANNLRGYIESQIHCIDAFLRNNKDHVDFNKWLSFKEQLRSTNIYSITYPLQNSLEKYYLETGKTVLSTLQMP